jgi:hypothetical protein
MDPFLEDQEWEDFHPTFNTVVRETLAPLVRPRYLARVERRVYIDHPGESLEAFRRGDLVVIDVAGKGQVRQSPTPSGAIVAVECELPLPEERRETFLVIREHETQQVVTVLETLSPANKRAGRDGRREYLRKRETILASQTNLVELDLLRGGARPPMVGALPPGDADVWLDLQAAFSIVYDHAGYDLSLDYQATLTPPVSDEDAAWIAELMK